MALWFLIALLPLALAVPGPESEYFDILQQDLKEWRLIFRGTAGIERSLYDAYMTGAGIPSVIEDGCKGANWTKPCLNHYRNDDAMENWIGVKDVLFGIVKDGALVKTIMFNGTDSTNLNWFSNDRVIESCYPDLLRLEKNFFSIAGHVTAATQRRFFINHVYGGCPNDEGWVVTMDEAERACDWEEKDKKFPLIKYASSLTVTNWNVQQPLIKDADALVIFARYQAHRGDSSEYHDVLNTGMKEYRLAFRGTADIGVPMYPVYKHGPGIRDTLEDACKTMDFTLPCSSHYRNDDALDNWDDIEEVLLGIVDGGTIVKYMRFNGLDTTMMDWYRNDLLSESCWRDIRSMEKNFFSIVGDETTNEKSDRRFFINHLYNSCPNDSGWLAVIDNAENPHCDWERKGTSPRVLYAAGPRVVNWNSEAAKDAEAIVILLKYRN